MSNPSPSNPHKSGPIGETRVADVLRDLETSARDARVWFESEFGMGEVLVRQGRIVQARLGGVRGRTALLRLLTITEGKFGVEARTVGEGEPIVPCVSDLVVLHTQRQAEWKELCIHAPPLSSVLRLCGNGSEVRDSSRGIQRVIFVLIDGRRSLMQVLEESSFDPIEALKIVTKAIEDGLVQHAPQPTSLFPLSSTGDASGVLPRFATPPPMQSLEPTSASPFRGAESWRHATLVGLGKQVTAPGAMHSSLAPSPIIDLGHKSTASGQFEGVDPQIPSRTKTVVDGFGLKDATSQERPEATGSSYAIDNELPPAKDDKEEDSSLNPNADGSGDRAVKQEASDRTEQSDAPPAEDVGLPSAEFPAAPEVATQAGTRRFVDRYEVLLRIGRGGMGTVYLCRLSSGAGFRRLFALKLLRSHLARDTQAAKDFLEEARVAGYLHHSNVVAVSDAGFHGKQPYLVMDYVEGCSLKQLLRGPLRPSPRLLLPIIIDALAGLHAAHTLQDESGAELRLVHCDVSPENLLVGVDGTCRLTDFGVARKANRSLGSTTKGKPGYVSPEQIAGQTFDHRADIFSMGVVLWNALTGQRLFAGATVEETLEQVCKKDIPAPSAIDIVSSPPQLDRVVLRALSRDPNQRFSTADDMLTALRAVELPGELATAREIAAWVRDVAGSELTQRRLAILDASRRPTLPPDNSSPQSADEPPFSVAVPSLSMSASEHPDADSRTIAINIKGGKSTRIALWIAAALAIAAVVATLAYPREVAKYLNLNTDPVVSQDGVRLNVDQLPVAASSLAPAGPAATIPLVSPPQKTPSNVSSKTSQPVPNPEQLRQK